MVLCKRLLLVSESLLIGGAERQTVFDANLLRQAGWNVTLAYFVDGPLRQEIIPSVELQHIRARSWLKRCLELYAFCHWKQFDIIHSHQMGANLVSALVGRLLGTPVIVTEHGLQLWRNRKHRFLARLTYRCAAQVLAVSQATAQVRIERDGAPKTKISVMPNCYRPEFQPQPADIVSHLRAEYRIPDGAMIVGFVGRLAQVKRLDLLVDAVLRVLKERENTLFLVVGDGSQRQKLERSIEHAGIAGAFRLVGEQSDIPKFLALMDVFVLSSERESLSVSLVEAAAMGVPQVAFDVGGNREIVVQGETGLLVPFPDSEKFAKAILSLLASDSRRIRMKERTRQRAQRLFSPEVRLQALNHLYEVVMAEHSLPPEQEIV